MPYDPRPTRQDLRLVAREVLPDNPTLVARLFLTALGVVAVRSAALVLAAATLPGVHFLGDGRPPVIDVVLACLLTGIFGVPYEPLWRKAVGPPRLLGFAATVFVLDVGVLQVVDVVLGASFEAEGRGPLLAAAAVVALSGAVSTVLAEITRHPDPMRVPE